MQDAVLKLCIARQLVGKRCEKLNQVIRIGRVFHLHQNNSQLPWRLRYLLQNHIQMGYFCNMFSLCFLYVLTGFEAVEESKSWRYLNQQVMLAIQLYLDDTIMGYHNYALLVELTRSVHNMG